jgi:hypothetical protein
MRFLAEDRIASEIAEEIKRNFDYNYSSGSIDFDYEIELDDEFINIAGVMDYEVKYEEDVNYAYISWVYIDITSSIAYNDDGDEIKFDYSVSKIEKYIKNYLTE